MKFFKHKDKYYVNYNLFQGSLIFKKNFLSSDLTYFCYMEMVILTETCFYVTIYGLSFLSIKKCICQ